MIGQYGICSTFHLIGQWTWYISTGTSIPFHRLSLSIKMLLFKALCCKIWFHLSATSIAYRFNAVAFPFFPFNHVCSFMPFPLSFYQAINSIGNWIPCNEDHFQVENAHHAHFCRRAGGQHCPAFPYTGLRSSATHPKKLIVSFQNCIEKRSRKPVDDFG